MKRPRLIPLATVQGLPSHFRIGQILDLSGGKSISFEELIERIASKDLIFVGEVHDNPEHHLVQVQILQALVASAGPVGVAMEFFQEGHQPSLDRYLGGEINEEAFLKEVAWDKSWGYNFHFYRPLLLLAKEKAMKVLAINAPNEIVRKVAREGLKGLDIEERKQLPRDIDLTHEAHRAYLRDIYKQHAHSDLINFEYFYEAQCVWEETMARNLSKYQEEKGEKLIVFTGNGHIFRKFGIPDRAVRRFPASLVTIMPYPIANKEAIERDEADYVWLTPSYLHRPRLPPMERTTP